MKKVLNLVFGILLIVSITDCKKPAEEVTASLTINPTTKEIDANSGSFQIAVASTIQWTVSSDKNWITVSPMTGTGNATVKVDYQDNASSQSRTASIIFKGLGVEDKVVSVSQSGIQPILTISPANLSVMAEAGNTVVEITSNLSWIVSSNQTWCTPAQSSGIGNASLTLNFQANTVQSQRTAIITFAANGVTNQTVQITQAEFIPALAVTPQNQTVNSPQGSVSYTITSNIAWTAICAESWCTIANPNGSNSSTLVVNYSQNTTPETRVATIIVSGNGVSNQSVVLMQTNLIPTLEVTPPNQDVTSAAGNTTFNITSNSSWTAESDQTWCAIVNATGSGNSTLSTNYENNITNSQRIATITVTVNGLVPKTVTVSQQGTIIYLVNDDFESYDINTFPYSGGWILKYDGAGSGYQIVTNNQFYSGNKSLQILGTSGWCGTVHKYFSYTPQIVYFEAWIKTTGDDQSIGFQNGNEGSWGTSYASIYFGSVLVGAIGNNSQDIQNYNLNQWYKIKLKYNTINSTMSVWIDDILKIDNLNGAVSSAGYSNFILQSGSHSNYLYVDDFRVWYEQ